EALRREAGFDPAGRPILVLGAGGAARAIVFALADAGAERIDIRNRTRERAEELARDTGVDTVRAVASDASPAGYACVINTTSVGMEGTGTEDELPCPLEDA